MKLNRFEIKELRERFLGINGYASHCQKHLSAWFGIPADELQGILVAQVGLLAFDPGLCTPKYCGGCEE